MTKTLDEIKCKTDEQKIKKLSKMLITLDEASGVLCML